MLMIMMMILFNYNVNCISYKNKKAFNIKGGWNSQINNNINNNSNHTSSSTPNNQQSQIPSQSNDIKPTSGTPLAKGFWINTKFMERFFKRFLSLFFLDPDILRITSKICAGVFWVYMALSTLGTLGFDTKPLLSLFSISGLTIGFAAKDILTNTFAGIFILFTRPFKRGQIISVNNMRGRVVSVDVRYVKLQNTKDKSETLIPLSLVYSNAITIEKDDTTDSKKEH